MIVPRYYENLNVLHEIHSLQGHTMYRLPVGWMIWSSTEKDQIGYSY